MFGIVLQRGGEVGLSQQIYLSIQKSILSGILGQGEALPSTRELAAELAVSRNTVCTAYDMLWTEGYIENRQGAPSRVADGLKILSEQPVRKSKEKAVKPSIRWDFKTGKPDLTQFPWTVWSKYISLAANTLPARQYAYTGPKGYAPLCEEIARWLMRARNMRVDPGDVFITSGSTQALHLLIDILHREGQMFGIENPSHPGVRVAIRDRGYPLCFLPVDEQGAQVQAIQNERLSAVYVTPSHQFPLGGILPANRRTELIRLAAEKDFYIIEDDYDSEFRYIGPPISPIYSMDSSRVVYVGTFSKTLFPALRIGFVVLPKAMQQRWRHSRNYMDVQNPVLEQAALTEFLKTRKMDKHIRRMKRLYGEKREALLMAVQKTFGGMAIPMGDASGLHIALQFPGFTFKKEFSDQCEQNGIRIVPVTQYCAGNTEYTDTLLVGYGHLSTEQIGEGIQALRNMIGEHPVH